MLIELVDIGLYSLAPLRELAARTATRPKNLSVVLQTLETRGIVHSARGTHGGFRLGRNAELARSAGVRESYCLRFLSSDPVSEEDCVLREVWIEVREAITDVVDNITFADLASRRRVPVADISAAPGSNSGS